MSESYTRKPYNKQLAKELFIWFFEPLLKIIVLGLFFTVVAFVILVTAWTALWTVYWFLHFTGMYDIGMPNFKK